MEKKYYFPIKFISRLFSRATDVVCVYIYFLLILSASTAQPYNKSLCSCFHFFSSVSLFSVETGYETITVNERSFSQQNCGKSKRAQKKQRKRTLGMKIEQIMCYVFRLCSILAQREVCAQHTNVQMIWPIDVGLVASRRSCNLRDLLDWESERSARINWKLIRIRILC